MDWLRAQAISSPEQTALVWIDPAENSHSTSARQSWNYRTLDQEVDRLASNLFAIGVRPDQHVAALLRSSPQMVFLVHALARLEAVFVPLNTRLTIDELTWQVRQADCALLIHSPATQPTALQIKSQDLRLLNLDDLPSSPPFRDDQPFSPPFKEGLGVSSLECTQAIIFTSGTTGQPKGAQLTFGNHFWNATASAYRLGVDPSDRWLATMPLYHVGGLAMIFRSCLYGTTLVLQDGFDPGAVLASIENDGITQISLVPTMLHRLLEIPSAAEKLAHLRYILLGGAAAPATLVERGLAAGLNLALTYGLTETASQIVTAAPDQTRRKPGSVGKPLLLCQARILDESGRVLSDGQTLPAGQIGQIAVSGPILMKGYYGQPDREGELLTGDLGYLDEEGDLWVVQRRVDLIVSGGENVYPAEVEALLLAHPGVESACVVGIADPEWGQQVAAAVVLRPGAQVSAEGLMAFCRQRLAGYKAPRRVLFMNQLPQTESGKVIRQKVYDLFEAAIPDRAD